MNCLFRIKESPDVDGLDLVYRFNLYIYPYIDMKGETYILVLRHLIRYLILFPSF